MLCGDRQDSAGVLGWHERAADAGRGRAVSSGASYEDALSCGLGGCIAVTIPPISTVTMPTW